LAHIGIGLLILIWIPLLSLQEFLSIAGFFLIVFIFFYRNKIPQSIYLFSRKTYGELTYIAGVAVLGIFLYDQKHLLNLGLLLLIFPDSISGLYNFFSRKKNLDIIHAAIHFIISIALCIFYLPLPVALFVSASLTLVEYLFSYGFDNLMVPLAFIILMKFF
jgi:hypothetical protein